MINLVKLDRYGSPGDVLLTGTCKALSIGGLIQFGQRPQTPDGRSSHFSHVMFWAGRDVVAESTVDLKRYDATGKRLDTGPQWGALSSYRNTDKVVLLHFKQVADERRTELLAEVARIVREDLYQYDITGLLGSLLTYWLLRWVRSNPLSEKRFLFCSAFVSMLMNDFYEYKVSKNTYRNTSPELIWQWALNHPELVQVVVLAWPEGEEWLLATQLKEHYGRFVPM